MFEVSIRRVSPAITSTAEHSIQIEQLADILLIDTSPQIVRQFTNLMKQFGVKVKPIPPDRVFVPRLSYNKHVGVVLGMAGGFKKHVYLHVSPETVENYLLLKNLVGGGNLDEVLINAANEIKHLKKIVGQQYLGGDVYVRQE